MKTRCCIAGGGPAGIMLGYLLARSGIDVLVLEKHADFFRDFRGDTVHPSTLDVIAELGLLDDFLALPHQEMTEAAGMIGDTLVQIADLSHLPTRCKFIALMPQWDFLNFLAEKGKRYSDFRVLMATEVSGLIEEDGIVTGVRAYNVRADLRANLPRLLEYVRNGGTLIDQYNVTDSNLVPMGPYKFSISHARVDVEEAPVVFPNPQNPLLRMPNEITQKDFEGWIQERGLYFASEWDAHYETVLESHDPGEKPQAGGMLYTRYGKGVYIFSGYSWFRELPAGVPGAYRIFANMLSGGRD